MANLKTFAANDKGRDFVIGDLHGSFSLLERMLEHVSFDIEADRLFSVGDLVDRGPESLECLELLQMPWFHAVYSNHENMMEEWFSHGVYGQFWEMNGGDWFFELSKEDQEYVKGNLLPLVSDLPYIMTVNQRGGGKFHVVHAEFASTVTDEILANPESQEFLGLLADQANDGQSVIWGRAIFRPICFNVPTGRDAEKFKRGLELNKMLDVFGPGLSQVFSGHTVVAQASTVGPQTNLDTGAVFSHRKDAKDWMGLTMTEPATGRFWLANQTSVKEVNNTVFV